jgi:hypothetical protein
MYMRGHSPHFNRYTPFNSYSLVTIFFVRRWLLNVFPVLYVIFRSAFLNNLVISRAAGPC